MKPVRNGFWFNSVWGLSLNLSRQGADEWEKAQETAPERDYEEFSPFVQFFVPNENEGDSIPPNRRSFVFFHAN